MRQISGNKLLVKALKEEGVDTLFGYPGACTIDISDELYKQSGIDIILPRHEQALVHEADAYARTTGKVGVCLVTSSYADRVFTTEVVAFPGAVHINEKKDFTPRQMIGLSPFLVRARTARNSRTRSLTFSSP